ncbi:hypothetical protein K8R03_02695 [Candidatus Kaiserbacteria bacterium]|nr:hypothetical protein [Candidatus Kaiserbacteria bacterium]
MKYLCDPHVIPTNTCPPDLSELERRSREFAEYAPLIQLDICDGVFAPVVSWPYRHGQMSELERLYSTGAMLPCSESMQYEVHLMVSDPRQIGALLARAGAFRVLAHVESLSDADVARDMFAQWKAAGAQEVGLSVCLDTPLDLLESFIPLCDAVQLMSIAKVGAQGQPFDERALQRAEELHAHYPDLMVAVDGGISEANVELLVRAGANRLCVGSAISKADNPASAYAKILDRAMRGCAPRQAEVAV